MEVGAKKSEFVGKVVLDAVAEERGCTFNEVRNAIAGNVCVLKKPSQGGLQLSLQA